MENRRHAGLGEMLKLQTIDRQTLDSRDGSMQDAAVSGPSPQDEERAILSSSKGGKSEKDEAIQQPTSAPEKQRKIHGIRWILIVLAIMSNLCFYAIDNTIVAVIQPVIVREFGDVQNFPWISVGFLMAGTATALINGKLFGAFNAKTLYIAFSLLFLVGSIICGAAPNLTALIFGRVIGGLGGTGMYLGALTLISVNTSPKETTEYMGYLALVWGFGSVIGPLIGGAFTDSSATWRWGFYINAPVIGIFLPVYFFIIPSYNPRPNEAFMSKIRQIDWLGGILSCGAFVTGIIAISFGGTMYAWGSAQIIALFVISGVLFIVLVLQQHFEINTTLALRVLPLHLFKTKDMVICFICQDSSLVAVALVVPVPLYYIPVFFQLAKGDTAIQAGIKTLPLICFWVTSSAIRGRLMGKLGWYQPWYVVGSIFNILAGVFLYSVIYGLQILSGIGTGCFGQAGFAVAQRLVPPADIHRAISLMLIAQLSGTTIGLALAGAIFQNVSLPRVREIVPSFTASQLSELITQVSSNSSSFDLSGSQKDRVLGIIVDASADTYVDGFKETFMG
ncbi:Efflux pump DEP3 [Lachnellula suecica]|uniref:Efflux pump DEP3 n=1 Tax=Lachnellula suecica TaxID=602035 RepID=A0A8T9CC64_9HELO|nr:Efflux pump DEP3 [Lachnellula suecica]